MQRSVYFDHAAAELPHYEVKEFVKDALDLSYNPSAIYERGIRNRQIIETTRRKIAEMINCDPEEIYFTSGCSEANSWAIDGYLKEYPEHAVYSTTIEHSSIDDNPNINKAIKVDHDGYVDLKNLREVYENEDYANESLWVVQHGNNVTGSIQDLKKIRSIIKYGTFFVDAAQTFGKIKIDVKELKIDMLSASARKIGGIAGAGFLFINKDLKIKPLCYGSQENNLRGGTYNELAIGAFGVALDLIDFREQLVIKSRRDFFIQELKKIKEVDIIGTRASRLPGVILFRINGLSIGSQALVGLLDDAGYMVSQDSACHAGEKIFSHVLSAMGYEEEDCKTVCRVSIGIENSVQQIQQFIKILKGIIKMYKE